MAEQIHSWGAKSAAKTEAAIDAMVGRHDPGGLRVSRQSSSACAVEFGTLGDAPGFTMVWARLFADDGATMCQRVDAIADSVCEADPRSIDEHRNDACAAMGAGLDALACRCATGDCGAAGRDRPARNTAVYIVAGAHTINHARRQDPATPVDPGGTRSAARCESGQPPPGWVFGAGVASTPPLGALIEGAQTRVVHHPGAAAAEDHYAPVAGIGCVHRVP